MTSGPSSLTRSPSSRPQRDAVLMPYLRALSSFRDQVRQLAMSNAASSDILALCDRLRDEEMVELGVALDDQDGASRTSSSSSAHAESSSAADSYLLACLADGRAMVKLVPAAQLRAARDAKAALAAEKAERKAAAAAAAEQKRLERLEKGRVDPQHMFRTDEYSAWDEAGMPTKDREGNEVPKSRTKKLAKEYAAQQKCVAPSLSLLLIDVASAH